MNDEKSHYSSEWSTQADMLRDYVKYKNDRMLDAIKLAHSMLSDEDFEVYKNDRILDTVKLARDMLSDEDFESYTNSLIQDIKELEEKNDK